MTNVQRLYSGEEWELEMIALLMRRYALGDFFEVPAVHKGDLGLDGVGSDGCVYQCYAPQGMRSAAERRDGQKGKIYDDLSKLKKNADDIRPLLDGIVVRRWILLVPELASKDVQAYANVRARVVRESGLDFISDDFRAVVSTDVMFAAERKAIANGVISSLQLEILGPSEFELAAFHVADEHATLVANLRRKLAKLPRQQSAAEADRVASKYLLAYLRGRDLQGALQQNHAEIWESIQGVKRSFELLLDARSTVSTADGSIRILDEMEGYQRDLRAKLRGDLNDENISQLVAEATADWLMRCPLDFPVSV